MNREANTGLKHCDNYKPITLGSIQSEGRQEDRALVVGAYLLKQFRGWLDGSI